MLVIGIAGGSGSGKTTVVKAITRQLQGRVVVIPQDSYYKDSSHVPVEERKNINFDHPDAIDWKLMCQQLLPLHHGNRDRGTGRGDHRGGHPHLHLQGTP